MTIKSKYDIGDTVFIIQYNQLFGRFVCIDYVIKNIIYDGTEIIYGFVYNIEARESECYEGKLIAQRTCKFLNMQLEWVE